jgi:hypothetical protein
MKRKILAILSAVIVATTMTSCMNRAIVDVTYNYERAIIALPNGDTIDGKVEKWVDYENSDMIQVKVNGKWYLTHMTNVVLITK